MDKTLKLHAYSDAAKSDAEQGSPAQEKNISVGGARSNAQIEELDLMNIVAQLRESIRQEQAKTAGMEAKINKLVALGEEQLAKKNAQLAEEKKKSLELMKMIEQLRDSIKQDQENNGELQAKTKELAVLAAKVKELSAALGKISAIAAMVKSDSNT